MNKDNKYVPLISVIVPVYNVEQYISTCLDSLVQQNIGLKNIEIIIVDDRGTDASMDIVAEYVKKYPETIRVITQTRNRGLGAARNRGFKESKGRYISFIDSDDFINIHTFKFLVEKIKNENADIALYAYEYFSNSGKKYERNPSANLFSLNKTISNYEYPSYPELVHALGACNKLYKREVVEKSPKFPEGSKYEDGYFSVASYLIAERIYITDKTTYFYRKREDNTQSIMDEIGQSKSSYFDHISMNLQMLSLLDKYPFMKYSIDWLNMRTWFGFAHNLLTKTTGLTLSADEEEELFEKTKTLYATVDPGNSYLDIDDTHTNLVASLNASSTFEAASKDYKHRVNSVKLKKGIRITLGRVKAALKLLLSSSFYRGTVNKIAGLLSCCKDNRMLRGQAEELLKKHNGNLWLFCERGNEAKDNAYALFKYIRENHAELPAYYLIDKNEDSPDYQKIKKLGNIIDYQSEEHKVYFLAATKLISTHARGLIEPWRLPYTIRCMKDKYWNKKFIFLQHGVILNNLKRVLSKESVSGGFDMFICGAKPEYDYVSSEYGYESGVVKYTGLARYDGLHGAKTKDQILLMPTWRQDIVQSSWNTLMGVRTANDEVFLKSLYFETYQNLINSTKLHQILEKNDIELIFYPHFEIQQYLQYFTSFSKNIKIASKDEYDVQTLLKESKLLITDYSSVLFDFAYMNKPAIYYQFDESEFFISQYPRGYFNYRRDGFGPTVVTEEEVVKEIEAIVNNKFLLPKDYKQRINNFFELYDKKNSERIYEAVSKL